MNAFGEPYPSVVQPNHIETVVAIITPNGQKELWKLSRYFDNPQFWSEPHVQDVKLQPALPISSKDITYTAAIKTQPVQEEFELYNLTDDPLETCNLANPAHATTYTMSVQQWMMHLLEQQRKEKRLVPKTLNLCSLLRRL